ncbi:Protein salvador -like protein 1 [Halotydeus destructor]|nr:Protein salvador -like protein 1 [Halotydeus destructor]
MLSKKKELKNLRDGVPGKYVKKDTPPEMPIINVWTTINRQQGKKQANLLRGNSGGQRSDFESQVNPSKPKTLSEKCAKAQSEQLKNLPQPFNGTSNILHAPSEHSLHSLSDFRHQQLQSKCLTSNSTNPPSKLVPTPAEIVYSSPSLSTLSASSTQSLQQPRYITTLFTTDKSGAQVPSTSGSDQRLSNQITTMVASHNAHQNYRQTKVWTSQPTLRQPNIHLAASQLRSMQNLHSTQLTTYPINSVQDLNSPYQSAMQMLPPTRAMAELDKSRLASSNQPKSRSNSSANVSQADARNQLQPVRSQLNLNGPATPWVPANPYLSEEIPRWLFIYSRAPLEFDNQLKWELFRLPELECFLALLNRLHRQELEELVMGYEACRNVLQSAIEQKERDDHDELYSHHAMSESRSDSRW